MKKTFNTKKSIEKWLNFHGVSNYIIHDDLIVDVMGSVNLSEKKITHLPFQFGVIHGYFDIMKNFLTDFKGFPFLVEGECSVMNNKITSLKGCPKKIQGSFLVSLNELHSLSDGPEWVRENFVCVNNPIKTLVGFNTLFGGSFIHGASFDFKPIDKIEHLSDYYYPEKHFQHFCEIDKYTFDSILTIVKEKALLEQSLIIDKEKQSSSKHKI